MLKKLKLLQINLEKEFQLKKNSYRRKIRKGLRNYKKQHLRRFNIKKLLKKIVEKINNYLITVLKVKSEFLNAMRMDLKL